MVHATFQAGGLEGKEARFRENHMWLLNKDSYIFEPALTYQNDVKVSGRLWGAWKVWRTVSERETASLVWSHLSPIVCGSFSGDDTSTGWQVWMGDMEEVHGDVPQLQRHFWAAAYQIALFRDALGISRWFPSQLPPPPSCRPLHSCNAFFMRYGHP
jgi:hypothetical protein